MGTLETLRGWKKEQVLRLIEAEEITRQIAEAVERGDHIAVQMLLGEREEPVRALHELEERVRAFLPGLEETEAIRMNELLRGAAADTEEEKPLAEQVARFRRLFDSVTAMDRRLSIRLGGNRSFYKKFRG